VLNHVPPQAEIVDYGGGDACGLTVRGEIDVATSPQLKRALDQAIRERTGAVVLDLSDLRFLDITGLKLMLAARAALAREARSLAIVCPPGPVRRVMEIIGVDEGLWVYNGHAELERRNGRGTSMTSLRFLAMRQWYRSAAMERFELEEYVAQVHARAAMLRALAAD
jgi:anti-anti-sigma factor